MGVTNEPSWIVPERLFWRDCDFKGKTVTVSMIEFHFDNNGISGVSCHYDSGLKRTIGTPARETAVLNFGENEWPAGLDVGYCFFPPNIWSITVSLTIPCSVLDLIYYSSIRIMQDSSARTERSPLRGCSSTSSIHHA